MADPDLPEIPPSGSGRGKQIVFLFMSAVVIAVVIFLLGVSVGRGVRKSNSPTDGSEAGDTTVAATPPVKPADLNYHDALQAPAAAGEAGRSTRPVAPAAPPAVPPGAPPPPVSDAPSAKPSPGDTAGATSKPQLPPAGKITSQATAYSLQVGAFNTMSAARSLLAQVKAKDKSYPVSTVTLHEGEPGRFRVVVGPYPTADEANRVMSRLKKDGFDAILKR
jgi:cell division protein FtsN